MVNSEIRLIIFSAAKVGEALFSQNNNNNDNNNKTKTGPGADCGSDQETLIAKFRLKLKKIGKTTRSFRYDINKIPYHYTEAVMNRFKGLDLVDRVPEELWIEVHNTVQEGVIKTIPKKNQWKKANGSLRRRYK